MKFGKQLALCSVKSWQDQYMSYKRLKRAIKKISLQIKEHEKAEEKRNDPDFTPTETTRLLAQQEDARSEFFAILRSDIDKINNFYADKLAELTRKFRSICHHDEEEQKLHEKMHFVGPNRLKQEESKMQELVELYREFLQLQSYREINFTGFGKIMKKFDKYTREIQRPKIVEEVTTAPFYSNLGHLQQLIQAIESEYAKTVAVFIQLKHGTGNESMLVANPGVGKEVEDSAADRELANLMTILKKVKRDVDNPAENLEEEKILKPQWVFLACVLAFLVWMMPILPDEPRAHKCLSLLAMISTLWITEAVPFFVAGLCVPFFVVCAGILADPITGQALTAEKAAKAAFSSMFSDTVMLVLGGFAISSAFSKCQFELFLAGIVQSRFGKQPRLFLLAFMVLGLFLSMWISNVAAPVLLTSILLPIVRDFSRTSSFARALLFGLAVSCNMGGMISPLSSPQNAVAFGYLEHQQRNNAISFMQWVVLAVPFCTVCLVLIWVYLCYFFIKEEDLPESIPTIVYERQKLTTTHSIVLLTSFVTIALWCFLSEPSIRSVLGEMGVVAVIPFVVFFGSGILKKNDLLAFSWNLLLLIGSGSVLGSAVNSSRLLHIATNYISPFLLGKSVYMTTLSLLGMVFVVTTFVSHTVSAIILTPLIVSLSSQLGAVQTITFLCTMMMSGTMSLPMSSFPNVNSLLVDDDFGRPFLHATDFVKYGTPISIGLAISLATFGYVFCSMMF